MLRSFAAWLRPKPFRDVTGQVLYVLRPADMAVVQGRPQPEGPSLIQLEDGTEGVLDPFYADQVAEYHLAGPLEATIRVYAEGQGRVLRFAPVQM